MNPPAALPHGDEPEAAGVLDEEGGQGGITAVHRIQCCRMYMSKRMVKPSLSGCLSACSCGDALMWVMLARSCLTFLPSSVIPQIPSILLTLLIYRFQRS